MERLGVWERLVILMALLAGGLVILALVLIGVEVEEIEKGKRNDWINR